MPENYVIQTLRCAAIDYSDKFLQRMIEGSADAQLVANLRQFGQITPLLVWEQQNDRYQLLADYTSFQALRLLGCEQVVCRILPLAIPPDQRYGLQVLHGGNALVDSPILQASLLREAQQDLPNNVLLPLLSLMDLKPQQHAADELIALLELSESAILALHQGLLTIKSGKLIRKLSHQDQDCVVGLVQRYRLGGSKQHKLIEMITELAFRENTSAAALLKKWVPTNQKKIDNVPQQMHNLLRELTVACQPGKTKLDRQFQQFVNALSLPQYASIVPSSSFEDESLTLCLHFSDSEKLQQHWQQIKTVIQNGHMDR